MADHFDFIVVGRGMTGAAAARHLSTSGRRVALVGPDEPEVKETHQGVFGSHYDEGRITRTLDPDPVWGRLAARAIARYGEIERLSGIRFHDGRGCLYVVADGERLDAIRAVAEAEGAVAESHDAEGLRRTFPYFGFPETCGGVHEGAPAGHVSPRRLVAAQARIAENQGAVIVNAIAETIRENGDRATVRLAKGDTLHADRVLVAVGGYSVSEGLLADPLDLMAYGRTVLFYDLDEAEQARLKGMPSLIAKVRAPDDEIYMLPPVAYPDGAVRLKIGGEPDDLLIEGRAALGDWFRSPGRRETIGHLSAIMERRVPGLRHRGLSSAACITTYTRSGHPAIGWAGKRIAVMTGGCGAAAKSSDEIGRLGAVLLSTGTIAGEGYASDFRVDFR